MRRIPLDMYDDDIPEEMRRYLRHYGWHFNKKACDYAVSLIRKKNASYLVGEIIKNMFYDIFKRLC